MTQANARKFTQQNRRAWNEIAEVRGKTFPAADFFAQGGSTLSAHAVAAALAGLNRAPTARLDSVRILHLQCATGEDTLSWAVLGARAVGVDIADQQISIAQQKAQDAGLDAQFVAADIYDLPEALPEPLRIGYDVVFTGGGAIVWLPDLNRWAQVITSLLRPGGHFILEDEHPITSCLWMENGQLQLESDYFGRGQPEQVQGWYHFKGGEDAREMKYEFSWPLGDIVTALAQAGLIIERLEEFPETPEWRFQQQQPNLRRLPGKFVLVAHRPSEKEDSDP